MLVSLTCKMDLRDKKIGYAVWTLMARKTSGLSPDKFFTLRIHKTKAHRSLAQGTKADDHQHFLGNDVADKSAKAPAKTTTEKPSSEDRAKTFTRWDTDRDDVVTLAEYLAGQKPNDLLEARFKRLDKNADGKLTRGEFIDPSAK